MVAHVGIECGLERVDALKRLLRQSTDEIFRSRMAFAASRASRSRSRSPLCRRPALLRVRAPVRTPMRTAMRLLRRDRELPRA